MGKEKEIIGGALVIGGRTLSLSKAIRAGDFVFLTGQIPMSNGEPMTVGTIEDQTKVILEDIKATLKEAKCDMEDVVKSMIWLRERADFPGFNKIYGDYFPKDPPARSAIVSELLVDVRVEIEVIAYKPL
ncbi:MAG: enamine deaminase RidA [Rhodobacteraceae bacterium]|jgi:reactive intermediate/imine deaminase|nr:enamine deaminase RidA [Paracoccaceae bacterium]MBV04326.1 enamine deaminase RidA [Paracoccaceae bacterium]MDG1939333.1 RidA family protein [Paracoccaceae bacterium]MDG2097780.1 RidA family protein [Paracoccaceae bacterium]|tara:strand:+ start:4435 stop:4824 length:390 start_codon:yes stop_codon:yes gene_type:complete